jgi:hypothetical protein
MVLPHVTANVLQCKGALWAKPIEERFGSLPFVPCHQSNRLQCPSILIDQRQVALPQLMQISSIPIDNTLMNPHARGIRTAISTERRPSP